MASGFLFLDRRHRFADVNRNSAQNTVKVVKWSAKRQAVLTNPELADRVFMLAGSLLDHRDGAPNSPFSLEKAQQYDRVCEVGNIDRRFHVADEPMLGDRKECGYAQPIQELQQFVHVQNEGMLLGHRLLIPVEAIDNDNMDFIIFYAPAYAMRKLAGRKLRRIDLLDEQFSLLVEGFEIDTHGLRATEQEVELLVEGEQSRFLAALDRRRGKLKAD
jgi:hypothetical protein